MVEGGPAADQRHPAAPDDLLRGGKGQVKEFAGIELRAVCDDIDQVVGDLPPGLRTDLVGADIEAAVNLDRISRYDLGVEFPRHGQRHPAFAHSSGPEDLNDVVHQPSRSMSMNSRARKTSCWRKRINFRIP